MDEPGDARAFVWQSKNCWYGGARLPQFIHQISFGWEV